MTDDQLHRQNTVGRGHVSFGIKTTPMRVGYDEIVRVWRQADALPEIEHAWLWDHFLPLLSRPTDPVLEGWTLLAALAAQTRRLRLGHLVTSNAIRPPAVLGKMAATTDVIAGGRLVLGIGVGGTRQPAEVDKPAVAEYAAYGIPLVAPGEGIARLDETLTIMRRMWTEDTFDFDGRHYQLRATSCAPKPVQRPGPPILVGGWGDRVLRLVARHADIWNIPGPPHMPLDRIADRTAALDRCCTAIGRSPESITRSAQLIVSYDDPAAARADVGRLVELGFTHIVLGVAPPYPEGVARWLVDEIVRPVRDEAPAR